MKQLKEIILFICPDFFEKIKSFDFWLNVTIVIVGGIAFAWVAILTIKLVETLN
jgi:hypothetical protein